MKYFVVMDMVESDIVGHADDTKEVEEIVFDALRELDYTRHVHEFAVYVKAFDCVNLFNLKPVKEKS